MLHCPTVIGLTMPVQASLSHSHWLNNASSGFTVPQSLAQQCQFRLHCPTVISQQCQFRLHCPTVTGLTMPVQASLSHSHWLNASSGFTVPQSLAQQCQFRLHCPTVISQQCQFRLHCPTVISQQCQFRLHCPTVTGLTMPVHASLSHIHWLNTETVREESLPVSINTALLTGDRRAQELCESRGGRPRLPVPNKPTVSVDVKQHFNQPSGLQSNISAEN